jgi:hypothetical protein
MLSTIYMTITLTQFARTSHFYGNGIAAQKYAIGNDSVNKHKSTFGPLKVNCQEIKLCEMISSILKYAIPF